MKFKSLPAVLGASFILVLACSKDALFQQPVPGAPDTGGMASVEKMDFDMFGGTMKFAITSDKGWQIPSQSLPDWIEVEPMIWGAGTKTVTVHTKMNLDEIRSTTVNIETHDGEQLLVALPVAQEVVKFEVEDNKPTAIDTAMLFSWIDCFTAGNFDKPAKVGVKSNVDWKIELVDGDGNALHLESAGDQVTLDGMVPVYEEYRKSRELKEIDLDLMPEKANFGLDTMRFAVRITPLMPDGTAIPGKEPYELVLRQGNLLFLADWAVGTAIEPTEEGMEAAVFNELGPGHDENTSVTVTVMSEEDWKVSACPSWLALSLEGNPLSVGDIVTMDTSTGGKSRNLLLTLLEPNPFLMARETEPLRLTPVVDPQYQEAADQAAQIMPVKQKAYVFELSDEKGEVLQDFGNAFKNDDPGRAGQHEKYTVYFKTTGKENTDWEITDVPEWMRYELGKADNLGRIPIHFLLNEQNLDLKNEIGTGKTPVVLRSKLFGGTVPEGLSRSFVFTQDKFQFGMTMAENQAVGGVSFNMKNLPPALTAEKLASRYGGLFSIDAGPLSGAWQVAPGSSDWITLSLSPNGEPAVPGGSFSDEGYKIYFAPAIANQKENDESNRGVLKLVSSKHLQAANGDYNKVPDSAKYEWEIIQRGFSFSISPKQFPDVPAYSNDFSEREVTLNVTCDGNWEIRKEEIPDFLEPEQGTPLSGNGDDGNYAVVFKLKPNTGSSPKQSKIRVYCTDRNDQLESADIAQEAFVFELEDQTYEALSAYVKEDITIPFRLTEGARLKLQNTPGGDWINAEAGSANIRVKIGTNPSLTASREASVNVSVEEPSGISKSAKLTFSQHKYLFSLTPSVLNFTELSASKPAQEFELVSSGPWRLSAPEGSWIQLDKTQDDGDESPVKIKMAALDNNTSAERNIAVTLIADELDGTASRLTIQAHQSPFKWSVIADDDKQFNYSFGPLETQEYSLQVVSSGKWELRNLPEWMEASPMRGDGSEDGTATTVKFHATKNLSTDPLSRKSVKALLQSEHFAQNVNNFRQDITMGQAPFVWKFSSQDWTPDSTAMVWSSPISLDSKIFTLESSGEWELASGDKVIPVGGGTAELVIDGWNVVSNREGNVSVIQVIPTVNDSREAHTTEITVVSVEHKKAGEELKKALSLEQPAYVLNVGEGEDHPHFVPWNRENEDAPLRKTLSVSSSAGWAIDLDDENKWVRTENKGNGVIDLVVDNYNGTTTGRTATLALRSTVEGISLSQEIKVQQDSFVFRTVSPEQSNLYFTAKGGESDVSIVCSAPSYKVKSYPAEIVESADLLSDRLHIKVKPFSGAGGRKDKVILESHGVELPIDITQGEYVFRIDGMDQTGKSFSPTAGATSLDFTLTSNVAWSLNYPEEWLELVSGEKAGDPNSQEKSYSFKFRTKGSNTGGERFTGNIELTNSIETLIFPVVQEGFRVGEYTLPGQFGEYDAAAKVLAFATTVGWQVNTGSDSWIHVNPSSGRGPVELAITVDDNATVRSRSGRFTIRDTEGYGLTYTVSLSQKGFEWSVDPVGPHNFPALPGQGDSWSFTVKSSAPWEIEPDFGGKEPWCSWERSDAGSGKTRVTITANSNLKTEVLSADLHLTAKTRKGQLAGEETIHITQSAFVFDVTATGVSAEDGKIYLSPEGGSTGVTIHCTDGWTVNAPVWMTTQDALSGSGDKTVTLSVASNVAERREGVITVSSTYGGHVQQFTVIQDAFNVTPASLVPYAVLNAEAQSLAIVASGAWTVTDAPSWLVFTPSSGNGNASLQVSAMDNTSLSSRNGSFTVRYTAAGGYTLTRTYEVSQAAFVFDVTGTAGHAFPALPGQGESWSFTVESSSEWTMEADYGSGPEGWLSWTSSESGGKTTVSVTATENTATALRSASLKIQAKVKGETVHEASIPISQSAFVFDVTATGVSAEDGKIYLSPEGGSTGVTIHCTDGWTVNAPVWMTTQDALSGSGDKTVTLSVASNVAERREGVITISSTYGDHEQQYTVVQDAFNVTPATLVPYAVLNAEAQSLAIVASGAWTVTEGAPSWLIFTPSSGNGNASLQVSAMDNTSLSSRNGSFTVRYTAAGGYTLTRTYEVSQAAFVWSVTGMEDHSFPVLPGQGDRWSFTVESSSEWTIEADYGSGPEGWLSWTSSESGGKTTVSVTAAENTATEPRSASLRVQAKVKGETVYEASGTISQAAFVWSVTGTEGYSFHALPSQGESWSFTVESSSEWTIEADYGSGPEGWLSWTSSESGGKTTVIVTAAENTATELRSANLKVLAKVKGETVREASIPMSQAGRVPAGNDPYPVNPVEPGFH